jgi:hypothetical protein
MNIKEAELLVKKYLDGETSLEEEKALAAFLLSCGEALPPDLEVMRKTFGYYAAARQERSEDNRKVEEILAGRDKAVRFISPRSRRLLYAVSGLAAAILLFAGLYAIFRYQTGKEPIQKFADTCTTPEQAYREARKALLLVSASLNRGVTGLEKLGAFDDAMTDLEPLSMLNEGISPLGKLSYYDDSKEISTNKNK